MRPRVRRLKSDYESMLSEFTKHKYISFESLNENSEYPDKYIVHYKNISSVRLSADSQKGNILVDRITLHTAEIYLHNEYPRIKPQCFLLTEIFHPNIRKSSPNDICIGDYWSSGETLVDIVYQIGEMIMFQNYNIKSPLNGVAAKWARENESLFPIDSTNIRSPELDVKLTAKKNIDIELK
ncbi:MAG: hypothetical protein EDM69_00715 [Chlorobiota bacterium]|nr:MAG: hypothetical protein EDM69_00715 [Chlorobiota bacterium]OQY78980.1 MAG: hypothetical protein B6D43_01245 [Ignavibacteriales bacterium UTCHB1]